MKHSLWTLTLAVFIAYSKAGENILVPPPNLQCACLDDRLRFTCTIVDENRIGATWWSGTAFTSCDGGRIQLRHSNANAVGACDGGTIIRATSLGFEGNCITSELNIVVDSGLNNKTVQCVFASNSGMPTIGERTISLTTGPYEQAPSDVTLSNVSSDGVTFSWSQIDPNCSTVQYQITSDCGNCSLMTSDRSATCSNLQLSTTKRECTFNVSSVICGFIGPSSNPITLTLKVPDPPQVNLIPVYSSDSQSLTSLNIVISSQTDSFVIYEGISGSIMNYTIYFSSVTNSSISANCTDDGCESMVEVRPPTVCQPSSSRDSTVSVSAMNRLGLGPRSQPVTLECINSFVTVNVDSATSTLTCQFQNTQNINQKTCSVEYSVCGQEQALTVKGNNTSESPDRVTLQLSLPSGSSCYTYTVTAHDGISTAMVEGRSDQPDERPNNSSVIAAAVVVPIIILVVAIVIVSLLLLVLKLQCKRKDFHAYEDSPESKIELKSVANPTYGHIDHGRNEPDNDHELDRHRGHTDGHVKEKEPYVDATDNSAFDSLGGGAVQDKKGLESSDSNVVPPENNSEQLEVDTHAADNTDREYSNIGGGGWGALGGYGGDDDEDHGLY